MQEASHTLAAYESLADMDLIHDHTIMGPLVAGMKGVRRPPVVLTNHGPFTDETRPIFAQMARHASIIAISHSQARTAGHVPVAEVIHHGIDLDVHSPGPGGGDYLMFVGRMCVDKGVHHAVRIAKKAGWRLVLATKMREQAELDYFNDEVRPLMDPDDEMPAEMALGERLSLLRGAAAMLNPITWREPFGLVMAEALASATPVLAFPNGAAPEIIDPGRTGFLCRDEEEMISAVDRVAEIDRRQCREPPSSASRCSGWPATTSGSTAGCSSGRAAHAPHPGSGQAAHQRLAAGSASAPVRRSSTGRLLAAAR